MRGHVDVVWAWPLYPSQGLIALRALCRVAFPSLLSSEHLTVCVAYEPAVANLCVVCGHHSHSTGWTTANAALALGRSTGTTPPPRKYGWTVAVAARARHTQPACVCRPG